ncbi:MAG: hypothetical protein J6Q35_06535 [Rikenellaceae bacterium]|nr:hypothetical protein [Rikenellaceae bacterium]
MVDIEQDTYRELAEQIVKSLPKRGIMNRTFGLEIEEGSVMLNLTLAAVVEGADITPIWWECLTEQNGVKVDNCFSWSELLPFVNELRVK